MQFSGQLHASAAVSLAKNSSTQETVHLQSWFACWGYAVFFFYIVHSVHCR
jgi:hypothetical protein